MAIDLQKIDERKRSVIDLKKTSGLDATYKAQVILALDFSGSMRNLYNNGMVQDIVERILPFGLAFDDNGEVDFYLFENGSKKLPENITLKNLDGYINNKVIGKYQMGGTNYAPVLKEIHKDFTAGSTKSGFFKTKTVGNTMEQPVYIIFITDGENDDKAETESIVKQLSNEGFFIQFIGIGNENFKFLTKLDDMGGRNLDNADFKKVSDISKMSDKELYEALMDEFPGWTKQAKSQNLIKS